MVTFQNIPPTPEYWKDLTRAKNNTIPPLQPLLPLLQLPEDLARLHSLA